MPTGPKVAVSVEHNARRCAEHRRQLLTLFSGDTSIPITLGLMGFTSWEAAPEHFAFARIASETHLKSLQEATLYLADADMVGLLDAAANTMPDQELLETDLVSPTGFIYFAEPLPDRSGQPPLLPIYAMSWAWLPSHHPVLSERSPGDSVLITAYVRTGDIQNITGLPAESNRLTPNSTVMWTIGSLIGEVYGETPTDPQLTPGFYQRVLAAFWTLVKQPKLTDNTPVSPGRPTDQRKARRSGITNPTAPVHVIRLQRPTSKAPGVPGEPTDRHLTVRFGVRGHWRNQWLPSKRTHRVQWIDPYWKGPEDAPLMGGERVFLAHGTPPTQPQQPEKGTTNG